MWLCAAVIALALAPDDLGALIKSIESGGPNERLEAIKRAGGAGKSAAPAAKAICKVACRALGEEKIAAFDALGKVCPSSAKHIVTLIVDEDVGQRTKAAAALAALHQKESAAYAVPALVYRLRETTEDAAFNSGDLASELRLLLFKLNIVEIASLVDATVTIDPKDAEFWTVMQSVANFGKSGPGPERALLDSMREIGQVAMARAAGSDKERRRTAAAVLVKCWTSARPTPKAVRASAVLGAEGIPLQKMLGELRYGGNAELRDAAAEALEKIK